MLLTLRPIWLGLGFPRLRGCGRGGDYDLYRLDSLTTGGEKKRLGRIRNTKNVPRRTQIWAGRQHLREQPGLLGRGRPLTARPGRQEAWGTLQAEEGWDTRKFAFELKNNHGVALEKYVKVNVFFSVIIRDLM